VLRHVGDAVHYNRQRIPLCKKKIRYIEVSSMTRSANPAPAARRAAAEPADAISRHLGSRVRQLRKERAWSLDALAGGSGVSRSMLSQIERDQTNPTLAVTLRIARAFGLSLGELLRLPGAGAGVTVIRADDRAYHYRSDRNCRIRTLSPLNLEKDVELYELRLQAGGALRSAAHFEGTREFLTVHRGEVRVESAGEIEKMGAGDSASYRADVPHAIVNIGRTETVLFLVVIYR